GFSGWLAIDNQDLAGLDWVYLRKEKIRLAQGEAILDIYWGKVRIDGQEFDIPVYVGVGVTEFLLGRQWLKNRRLVVDFPSRIWLSAVKT
ncbi:MAG TPA: aspartyl protease, partial [Cyanobacteria bacterium UBA9273]|nr:aspartyl protease [Cyanobacteria bacterium UBA9273]